MRVTVVLCVCLSVKSHFTYGASVRPENAVTYSAGNEGQNICGVFSVNAPLLRSSGVAIVFHTFRWPFLFIAKVVRMHIGINSYACRTAGEYPACHRYARHAYCVSGRAPARCEQGTDQEFALQCFH